MRQLRHHDFGGNAEIDQAGDLVDADVLQPLGHGQAALRSAEETARLVVAREGMLEQRLDVRVGELLEEPVDAFPAGAAERREARGVLLEKIRGAAQVVLERTMHLGADECLVLGHERVEHQCHAALAGVSRLLECPAIDRELLGKLLDALPEQVGEHVRTHLSSLAEGLRVPGSSHPKRKLGLHRPRQSPDLDLSLGTAEGAALTSPEGAHGLDSGAEDLVAFLIGVRREGEVARLPAGGEGDADPSVGKIVDQRPLLGDADRAVQRQHTTPRADLHRLGDGGDGGAGERGIRIETAEGMKVPLGRPEGLEAIAIREPGSLEQKAVLVAPFLAFVAGEIEEAEADAGVGPAALARL